MSLLLDTHLLIWGSDGNKKLKPKTKKRILNSEFVYFSAASIAEISIKHALGKLSIHPNAMIDAAKKAGFVELAISVEHGALVGRLPAVHQDPFDRILIAQAQLENLTLLTSDKLLAAYGPSVEIV
jgi:PIN domain nuclease of toxin-antitoxin system